MDSLMGKWRGVIWGGAVVGTAFVVGAILFPYFAKPVHQPNVALIGLGREPSKPFEVVVHEGPNVRTVKTDGRFDADVRWGKDLRVDGFELANVTHSSGIGVASKRFWFAPSGTIKIRLVDEDGNLLKAVPGSVYRRPIYNISEQGAEYPVKGGELTLTKVPTTWGTRELVLEPGSPEWGIVEKRRVAQGNQVTIEYILKRRPAKKPSI